LKTVDFDYHLPPDFIAQQPIEPRDASRLMLLDRATGKVKHAHFHKLDQHLLPGDVLVFNDTRVISARLPARKARTGGKAEILLLHPAAPLTWQALIGGKGIVAGSVLTLDAAPHVQARVVDVFEGARRLVHFSEPIEPLLASAGKVPLPPYIHAPLQDQERYQTVYARVPGSAAAPTAGLHFTPALLDRLHAAGIQTAFVTLHVGLDTFAPVAEEDAGAHAMHGEWCELPPAAAELINSARQAGGRVIAVGTTSVRTLESAAPTVQHAAVTPWSGSTRLYILPGYAFKVVDGLITNFHLPRSTLLMLVSAFAGRENVLAAYETAKSAGYRFYSFGDAMLIV
jgi:S-adenosylmethionine:tRNA ribosyltransferase-isomerase